MIIQRPQLQLLVKAFPSYSSYVFLETIKQDPVVILKSRQQQPNNHTLTNNLILQIYEYKTTKLSPRH